MPASLRIPPFARASTPWLSLAWPGLTWPGLLLLTGCYVEPEQQPRRVRGLRPVYATYADMRTVATLAPQPLRRPGKIYVTGRYLFVGEQERGVHVIDNADPARPRPLAFVAIPGNVDVAVKDSTLYANNGVDLVALDMRDPRRMNVVKRLENVFPYPAYPTQQNVAFECANPDRGVVIRWEPAELLDPKCRR